MLNPIKLSTTVSHDMQETGLVLTSSVTVDSLSGDKADTGEWVNMWPPPSSESRVQLG